MKKIKTSFVLLFAALVTVAAHAGSFSRGGGSFSRGSSFSSSPARSIGMSRPTPSVAPRPSIQPSVAPPRPSYTPPRPTTVTRYAEAPHYSSGGGGGFLSSMAGGFTGSMLGNILSGSHGGGGGYAAPMVAAAPAAGAGAIPGAVGGEYAAAPVYMAAAPAQPSAGVQFLKGLLYVILGVCLLALLAWIIRAIYVHVQAIRAEAAAAACDPDELPFSPVEKFVTVQKAFAACDVATLRRLLGPDLVTMLDDLPPEGSEYTLKAVTYSPVYVGTFTVSIQFTASDTSDGSTLSEVWHFRRLGSSWVVNGIDQ